MKPILIAAAIFVSMGLIQPGSAQSSELRYQLEQNKIMDLSMGKVNLRFSGDLAFGMYVLDHDDLITAAGTTEYAGFAIKNMDSHLYFHAAVPFDNGLVAGYKAALDANGDFDENYVFTEGGFGFLSFGVSNNVSDIYHVSSPRFVAGNSVEDPNVYQIARISTNVTGGADSLSTRILYDEESYKLNYVSPDIQGLSFLFSYTPDIGQRNDNAFTVATDGNAVDNAITAAFLYETPEPIFGVKGSAIISYLIADGITGDKDPNILSAGVRLSYEDFTFGAGYKSAEDIIRVATNDSRYLPDLTVWDVGVSYGKGPWVVGVAFRSAELDTAAAVAGAAAGTPAATAIAKREHTAWLIGGSYNLGAGLTTGVSIELINDKDPSQTTSELDNFAFGISLALSF